MIIQYCLYSIVRLLFKSYKLTIKNNSHEAILPSDKMLPKGIYYFWHQHIVSGIYFFSSIQARGHCIISPSRDGQLAAFIAQRLHFSVLFGSAHKNPIALTRQALAVLEKEERLCVIGDGSRGPAFQLQRGISYLAEKSKLPLILIECRVQKAYTLKKSWDRCQIPLPFSKIDIIIHEPTTIKK